LRLLLDTHILVWWLSASPWLAKNIRAAIAEASSVYVSAASAWELTMKSVSGKLEFSGDLEEQLTVNNFYSLPIKVVHAVLAARLPRYHTDPFGRMLIAQASFESLTLVTADLRLAAYGVPMLQA
jgi:PIN domain nuclease of toxin-antitoxin system